MPEKDALEETTLNVIEEQNSDPIMLLIRLPKRNLSFFKAAENDGQLEIVEEYNFESSFFSHRQTHLQKRELNQKWKENSNNLTQLIENLNALLEDFRAQEQYSYSTRLTADLAVMMCMSMLMVLLAGGPTFLVLFTQAQSESSEGEPVPLMLSIILGVFGSIVVLASLSVFILSCMISLVFCFNGTIFLGLRDIIRNSLPRTMISSEDWGAVTDKLSGLITHLKLTPDSLVLVELEPLVIALNRNLTKDEAIEIAEKLIKTLKAIPYEPTAIVNNNRVGHGNSKSVGFFIPPNAQESRHEKDELLDEGEKTPLLKTRYSVTH